MRQMLFLVPMLSVMAALTWHYIIHLFKNKMAQRIVAAVFILALSPVVRFCVANHPNQYVYFNELVGGITKARLLYDTDYYMNSVKQCADWFKQSEMFRNADAQHKIRIATNTLDPVNHYFKDDTDKVKIIYTKWFSPGNEKSRANRDWDYGIYNSRTVEPAQLKYGIWPSEKTIYSATADGVPLSVIIERKDKSDYLGYLAFKKDSFELASTLYKKAIAYNKQNEEAYINLIQSLMNIKQYQECLVYCSQWHTVNPDNDLAYVYEGIALAYSGNIDQAFTPLQTAIKMNPDNYQAYTILAQLYNQKGDKQSAQYYYNQAE
jgi:tetratricopeptide (TPR) repeat protein